MNHGCYPGLYLASLTLLASCAVSPILDQRDAVSLARGSSVEGQFIVRLRSPSRAADVARRLGGQFIGRIGREYALIRTPSTRLLAARDPDCLSVESDRSLDLDVRPETTGLPAPFATGPDPLVPAQWGLSRARFLDVDASGSPAVTVAVIDSGIDASHPELEGRVREGWDFTRKVPGPGGLTDGYGHGTHVAGVIGARRGDGMGIAGIAPDCTLLSVRIFNDWGHSSEGVAAAAVTWAVDHGAKVINASWGTTLPGEAAKQAFADAVARGTVLVAAAGNSGKGADPAYPAAVPGVIAVAASTDLDGWPSFSSTGEHVSVAAPGESILSTYPRSRSQGYRIMSGTSMAAPHVSGLVALMVSREPKLAPAEIKDRLERTAQDTVMTGRDPYSGAGRIDAVRALGPR